MEGVLLKWTNYWNGWQTRWFVLQDGILSYYSSSEEVNQGCKGSMKVSALEIAVSSTDNTRMDLSIPGEKNMYLKAPSPQERQLWLVALGSSKACLTDHEGPVLNGLPVENKDDLCLKRAKLRTYCDLLMQQVHDLKTTVKREIPDNGTRLQKIEEESALISATCDSFIRTLEECIEVTKDQSSFPNKLPRSDRNSLKANNISRPTVPVMRTNSSEKKA